MTSDKDKDDKADKDMLIFDPLSPSHDPVPDTPTAVHK